MLPLRLILSRFVRHGHLRVLDHANRLHEFGTRGDLPAATIKIHDPSLYRRLALHPALHVGRAYVDGSLTVVEGSLSDFLNLLLINETLASRTTASDVKRRLEELTRLMAVVNFPGRARRNIHHHYDHPVEFYRLFLDDDLQYSCAYFYKDGLPLEEAQTAKKRHIAAKLHLKPGHRVLDIGCGFGGMALFLARNYGVHVTGVTLSTEQHRVASERVRRHGLGKLVDFRFEDYRKTRGEFDRIVSVGMFEHVGRPHYSEFLSRLADLLSDDGIALVHTIGRQTPPIPINAWMRENIFPGAYLPTLSQLSPILEKQDFWLTDFENLRLHYAMTLQEWNRRFQRNKQRIKQLQPDRYDDAFCRKWELYLQACEAGFRHSGLSVFQLQIARKIDALPLTRDYMFAEERRLMAGEAGVPGRPRMAGE